MKKALAVATLAIAVLVLTGCGHTLAETAAARDECHELGGTFRSWTVPEYPDDSPYGHECDLSDKKEG